MSPLGSALPSEEVATALGRGGPEGGCCKADSFEGRLARDCLEKRVARGVNLSPAFGSALSPEGAATAEAREEGAVVPPWKGGASALSALVDAEVPLDVGVAVSWVGVVDMPR